MIKDVVERARRYLAHMEASVSGSGGRAALFKAALALIKGFGLSEDEALLLLMEWNQGCCPPWSERELKAVLKDAGKASKPAGYLLGSPPAAPQDEAEIRRRKRQTWPSMRPLNLSEMKLVAALRSVSVPTVEVFNHRYHHFLWRTRWRDADVFVVRNGPSGTFAQARRLDGQPFELDGKMLKTLNLPGSEGKFLCPGGLGGADVPVLITEGVIGILEAWEFVCRAQDQSCRLQYPPALIAATAASVRFGEELLAKLQGRQVLILGDPDPAGQEAAAAWCGQLTASGCNVRAIMPPKGFRDFGGLLKTVPADDPVWSEITNFSPTAAK